MLVLQFIVILCTLFATVFASPASVPTSGPVSSSQSNGAGAPGRDIVTWNQSQHGKFNLQLSLKDFKIIAVLNSDNYDDDESLEYDYEDLEESTPDKPTSDSTEDIEDNIKEEISAITSHEETSAKPGSESITPSNLEHEDKPAVLLSFVADGKPENISQLPNDAGKRTALSRPELYHRTAPTTKPPPVLVCEPGYAEDRLKRCRKQKRRRHSFTPFKFNFRSFRDFRLARLAPHQQSSQGKMPVD